MENVYSENINGILKCLNVDSEWTIWQLCLESSSTDKISFFFNIRVTDFVQLKRIEQFMLIPNYYHYMLQFKINLLMQFLHSKFELFIFSENKGYLLNVNARDSPDICGQDIIMP